MARCGIVSIFLLTALFLGNPAAGVPYPIPGNNDDANHCSGATDQTVFYCVTPPQDTHCEEIMAESAPLYRGYRYECEASPDPARQTPPSAMGP